MSRQRQPDNHNPLLQNKGLPQFDAIQADHVVPAVKQILEQMETALTKLESRIIPTWTDLVQPLEALSIPFEQCWRPVKHLLGVKNSEELRKAHEQVLGDVVSAHQRLHQSRPIYDGLMALKADKAWDGLSHVQQRVVSLRLKEATLRGVGLDGEAKSRFNTIAKELSQLGTDFSNHVLDATKAYELIVTNPSDTEGWPESLKQLAESSYIQSTAATTDDHDPGKGPWRITLDAPSLLPFLQHSRNRSQREAVYRAFITRASAGDLDNSEIIERTLQLRLEKAKLLGYGTYAELSLASKMAPDTDAVEAMFQKLLTAATSHAASDFEELRQLAENGGQGAGLSHWDVAFWAERLRENRFGYSDDELRPYFPLPRVLKGLFDLCKKLFGINIKSSKTAAPVWHPDVRFFDITNSSGAKIASFYLDPYSRPSEKRGGAWMDNCLDRRIIDGNLQLPVAHLCCNGTPPVGDTPSLMSFNEVKTLFHEFGHGLQGMLTRIDLADVSGINGIEWDAVELPSQFMENWCYHRPTLHKISGHYQSGQPIPDDLVEKVFASKNFRAGSMMARQLELGMTDFRLHYQYQPGKDQTAFDVHRSIAEKTTVLAPLPEDRFLCAFSHIFAGAYAAGYYSYKWAEVLSADAFSAFEEAGLDDEAAMQKMGRRFRDTILSLGGSKDPMDVFVEFRGREPSTEALLRHNGLTN